MKKLLWIFFIGICFAQSGQNFLKKTEVGDSINAHLTNYADKPEMMDSILANAGTVSGLPDTALTLRQVIIDSSSAIRADMGNASINYIDSVTNLKLDKTALGDSLISARKPFLQVVLDSSIVSTTDTIPLGYLSESFTIDSLIVISYGSSAPNLTYQIYHSGSTAMFSSSQTKNTKGTTKIVSFNDATLTSGKVYLVFPSVASMPTRGKLAFYLIGHK